MVDKPPPSITFFSNVSGHRKGVTLGNGQIAINQADGVLETQTPSGTPRETRLDMIQPNANTIPFSSYGGMVSTSVQGALQELWDTKANTASLPTALSQFTNDVGYVTGAGVRSSISASGALSYNATTGVMSYTAPTLVSAFTNDSGYITTAGARSAVSATGSISYNSTTGVFSYTQPTNVSAFTNDAAYVNQAGARSAISATGSLSYNSGTGVISYTAPTLAVASDVRAGTDSAKPVTSAALMGAAAFVTDTWAATLTPDFSTGFNRAVTLTGNTTFGQPTNLKDGEPFVYMITQDATGTRTIAFNTTYWKFPGGTLPTASTAANAVDRLTGIMRNRSGTLVCEVFGYDKDIK